MARALEELQELFGDSGLAVPPIPPELAGKVNSLGEWCFASRKINPLEMYLGGLYPHEVLTGPVDDYVAISHAGHGVNSYALNYDLVYGWVALFVQVAWGGAYGDSGSEATKAAAWFGTCADVLAAVAQLRRRPRNAPGRLVVVQSDFRGVNICGWLPTLVEQGDADRWLSEHDNAVPAALDAAVAWLEQRQQQP